MNKAILAVAALFVAGPAAAGTWLVTEENVAGVKGAQGTWTVTTADGKISGDASMQSGSGAPLTYKFEGTVEGTNYTITLSERSDGKKNCVWKAHPPTSGSSQARGVLGYAECDGARLVLRGSPVE